MRTTALALQLIWVAALTVPSFAHAGAPELQLDLNSYTLTLSSPPFSLDYTGSMTLTSNPDAELADLIIDGVSEGADALPAEIDSRFDFENGDIAGGYIIVVFDASPDDPVVFTADIVPGVGGINTQAVTPTSFDFLMRRTMLSNEAVAGVDVGAWRSSPGDWNSGLLFSLDPAGDTDSDVDLDLFILAPTSAVFCDLNDDGIIDSADLAILLAAWGPLF